ncbi:MAG TPA: hypothetical protein VGF98_14130 [Candidatus Tumulicola sp.]
MKGTLARNDSILRIYADESAYKPIEVIAREKTEPVNAARDAPEVSGFYMVCNELSRVTAALCFAGCKYASAPPGHEVVERLFSWFLR